MSEERKSIDLLGIAPYGEAINTVSKGGVEFVNGLLTRICYPFAEEFGLSLQDRVRGWRFTNLYAIAKKAKPLLDAMPNSEAIRAHPRLVSRIVEEGSWSDDDVVQAHWAGLLASSCTADGKDEANLVFINLLNQLTSVEVHILQYACTSGQKRISNAGWILSAPIVIAQEQLVSIAGISDRHRLDRELDHLRALGLLAKNAGFQAFGLDFSAVITPEPLALHLYVRCQGESRSPEEYFRFQFGLEVG